MDPLLTQEEMERLVSGWNQAYLSRAIAAGAALFFLGCIIQGWRRRRSGALWMLTLGVLAVPLILFSAAPQTMVNTVISIEYVTRVRIIVIAVSILVLSITFESIRNSRLGERYALLWVTTALVMIAAALAPRAVALLRALTGMSYAAAMFSGVFIFIMLFLFHFSVTFSIMRHRIDRLIQRLALIEARLDSMRSTGPPHDPPETIESETAAPQKTADP